MNYEDAIRLIDYGRQIETEYQESTKTAQGSKSLLLPFVAGLAWGMICCFVVMGGL